MDNCDGTDPPPDTDPPGGPGGPDDGFPPFWLQCYEGAITGIENDDRMKIYFVDDDDEKQYLRMDCSPDYEVIYSKKQFKWTYDTVEVDLMNDRITNAEPDDPIGLTTFEGGYLRKYGLCLTKNEDDTGVEMQECYEYDEDLGLDNVDDIKAQTWIIDPKGLAYDEEAQEIPDDVNDTEFIIRATCTDLTLNHDLELVTLESCNEEGNTTCFNRIRLYN